MTWFAETAHDERALELFVALQRETDPALLATLRAEYDAVMALIADANLRRVKPRALPYPRLSADDARAQIVELLAEQPGLTAYQLSPPLCIPPAVLGRYLAQLRQRGLIVCDGDYYFAVGEQTESA